MSPEQLVAVIGALTALFIAITGVLVQVLALRRAVDGRLTQLLELTAASSRAAGALDETRKVGATRISTKVPE